MQDEAGRIHLRRRLAQAYLDTRRLGAFLTVPCRHRAAHLVLKDIQHALGHAQHRRGQRKGQEAAQRNAVIGGVMHLAARGSRLSHILDQHRAMFGNKGVGHADILTACASQPRDEPGIFNRIIRARQHHKELSVRAIAHQQHPARRIAAAGKIPLPRHLIATRYNRHRAPRGIKRCRGERLRRIRPIRFLSPLRKHADEPSVAGPYAIAPRRRAASPAEFGSDIKSEAEIVSQSSKTFGLHRTQHLRRMQRIDDVLGNAAPCLGLSCPLPQHRHQFGGAAYPFLSIRLKSHGGLPHVASAYIYNGIYLRAGMQTQPGLGADPLLTMKNTSAK